MEYLDEPYSNSIIREKGFDSPIIDENAEYRYEVREGGDLVGNASTMLGGTWTPINEADHAKHGHIVSMKAEDFFDIWRAAF
jgi:hypothetical protein